MPDAIARERLVKRPIHVSRVGLSAAGATLRIAQRGPHPDAVTAIPWFMAFSRSGKRGVVSPQPSPPVLHLVLVIGVREIQLNKSTGTAYAREVFR